ncbi:MAG TPA: EF-Tu/IF-2/RF-3 family GTPase, partial [Candidatus Thermoplasmatota archaeon]|nr:EF-Tu/IF-2/RF-3 family GTPase [Candidatus Thermoplasmatota archaeon]
MDGLPGRMRSVNAAVLGSPGAAAALPVASALGKKGSETDVVQFNAKDGDRSLTVLVPARYPERVQGLAFCLASSDVVLLSVEAVDRTLGEQVVAADALAPERGMLLLRNYVTREQVAPLLRNTRLAAWEILEDPPLPDLRERLLDVSSPPRPGPTKVVIDQHFNVKGVGTVALGIVARGEVRRHQDLTVHPTERVAQVRSIQVHDTDVDVAPAGSRVGLALKGVESDELDRGFVLAPKDAARSAAPGDSLRFRARVPPFFKQG